MRKHKRIWAGILAAVMLLALLPAGALAVTFTPREGWAPPSSYTMDGITIRVTPAAFDPKITNIGVREFWKVWLGGSDRVKFSDYLDSSGQWVHGFYDMSGNVAIAPKPYQTIESFHDGRCLVSNMDIMTGDVKYGYIDAKGELAIPLQYAEAKDFVNGAALVRTAKNGPWSFIDTSGKVIIEKAEYSLYNDATRQKFENFTTDFVDGITYVHAQDGHMDCSPNTHITFYDLTGKVVLEVPTHTQRSSTEDYMTGQYYDFIEPDYSVDKLLEGHKAIVTKEGTKYLLDIDTGKLSADVPQEAPANTVNYNNGKCALLAPDGSVLAPYVYDAIREPDSGLRLAYKNPTFNALEYTDGYLTEQGHEIVPVGQWNWLTEFHDGIAIGAWYTGKAAGLWGRSLLYYILRVEGVDTPSLPFYEPVTPKSLPTASWAVEPVRQAIELGLVPESLQSDYNKPITRAEFCALALQAYQVANLSMDVRETWFDDSTPTFTDTTDEAVRIMAGMNVVEGKGNGIFDPNGSITRQDAAALLYRLCQKMGWDCWDGVSQTTSTFADSGSIGSWAVKEVAAMQASGIMDGVGNNMFSPRGTYTRAQSIITILRAFQYAA